MKRYMTVKIVDVEEMTMQDYYKNRKHVGVRDLNTKEDIEEFCNQKVFKVVYSDGYDSVCPKDRFLEQAWEIDKENRIPQKLVDDFIIKSDVTTERIGGKLNTVLRYELANGFSGIESTSCVDEKNYSEEIGKEILINRLKDKIWFGLGFVLGMAQGKGGK